MSHRLAELFMFPSVIDMLPAASLTMLLRRCCSLLKTLQRKIDACIDWRAREGKLYRIPFITSYTILHNLRRNPRRLKPISNLWGCLVRSHTWNGCFCAEHICADRRMSYKTRIRLIIPSNLSVANKIVSWNVLCMRKCIPSKGSWSRRDEQWIWYSSSCRYDSTPNIGLVYNWYIVYVE